MICLTGDIHHSSLKINDQRYIPDLGDTEPKIASRYMELVARHGLKVTFYVTGRTFDEEWDAILPLTQSPLVEIGGHTYEGLPRPWSARVRSALTGRPSISHSFSHGSPARQARDVEKMIRVAREKTGRTIVSWRSHGLVADSHTYEILAAHGIRFISDDLSWTTVRPVRTPQGLVSHPMNVIMDHDHIYHAHRTPAYVEEQKKNAGIRGSDAARRTFATDPTRESYPIDEWAAIVERQVREIDRAGGVATVLMHPLCMYLSDRFAAAERLLKFFSQFRSVWASETEKFLEEKQ